MEKQLTAVEWLINAIDIQYPDINIKQEWIIGFAKEIEKEQLGNAYERGFNQALEMEKEQSLQTLKSFRHHLQNGGDAENLEEWFEQHYNETFKQEE